MNARLYACDERCTGELPVPPWSLEAEQAVLGELMLAPEMLVKIADWITSENFYRRDHQLIYRAILELDSKRQRLRRGDPDGLVPLARVECRGGRWCVSDRIGEYHALGG